MVILDSKDAEIIKNILEQMMGEIDDIRNYITKKNDELCGSSCGCVQCDHRAKVYSALSQIGEPKFNDKLLI